MNLEALARAELSALILQSYNACVQAGELPEGECPPVTVAIPKELAHGDLATPFAMGAAKALHMAPRAIADAVLARLNLEGSWFDSAQVAGAGFINVFYGKRWYAALLEAIEKEGLHYGYAGEKTGKRVMVEFVSANPTGPMTIGNARGGVLGDNLAAVLEAAGHDVWREFYLNDAGNQVENFAQSIECRYLQQLGQEAELPEDGYHGDYIGEYAKAYIAQHGEALLSVSTEVRREALAQFALPQAVAAMRRDLERYKVRFDQWFPESDLHKSGEVDETLELLTGAGYTYEAEGAVWFAGTKLGLDKDEVLRKKNGFYTYLAVDIAYHRNKFLSREFDTVIDVLGADHHGHAIRFPACMEAIGVERARMQFVLMQFVNLIRDGEIVRMSKRTGKAITLSDLLDEIPVDACRFFFNLRQPNTKLDFDMDLAIKTTSENPVYYVQYAHARICSLEEALAGAVTEKGDAALLTHEAERELLRHLAVYPQEILAAAAELEPSKINRYLVELAGKFHRFYDACRMKDQAPDILAARFRLAAAARQVLAGGLTLLGIDAPHKM